ncbi:hypothetical protein PYCC9005_005958 [Savitreella phatthalungensis]
MSDSLVKDSLERLIERLRSIRRDSARPGKWELPRKVVKNVVTGTAAACAISTLPPLLMPSDANAGTKDDEVYALLDHLVLPGGNDIDRVMDSGGGLSHDKMKKKKEKKKRKKRKKKSKVRVLTITKH